MREGWQAKYKFLFEFIISLRQRSVILGAEKTLANSKTDICIMRDYLIQVFIWIWQIFPYI